MIELHEAPSRKLMKKNKFKNSNNQTIKSISLLKTAIPYKLLACRVLHKKRTLNG